MRRLKQTFSTLFLVGAIACAAYLFLSNRSIDVRPIVDVPPTVERSLNPEESATSREPSASDVAVPVRTKTVRTTTADFNKPKSFNLDQQIPLPAEPKSEANEPIPKSEQPVVVHPELKESMSLQTYPHVWLWLGTGVNFQYYKQSIPGINGEAIFQNLQGPTVLVSAGAQGENFGFDLAYKETPGKMSASSTIAVTNGNYRWRTLSAEGLYRKNDRWSFRAGLQHHSMPFMALDATTAILDVKTNTLTMATVGFDRKFLFSNKLRFDWQMRFQHPLLAGSTDSTPFSVNPKFAFDGSVGSVYALSDLTRIGIHWYGQWHEYDFNYGRGASGFSGNQTLLYSNFEISLGVEFE